MWNCALKSFNAESCGSTLLIGDENNLSELADISVNILKLPTEDPTNPENMGMLVMLNGFGECMQKYFQLEQVAFNVSRHTNFANLVNRIDWFSNQTVNQGRIDELIAAERALTTSELSDLAVSLGFQNTQALNDFGCNTETDINIIKGSITSVASEDEIVVLNSASKYYPDQTKITASANSTANLVVALKSSNCSGLTQISDFEYRLTLDEFIQCGLKEGIDFVTGKSKRLKLLSTLLSSGMSAEDMIKTAVDLACPECALVVAIVSLSYCLFMAYGN